MLDGMIRDLLASAVPQSQAAGLAAVTADRGVKQEGGHDSPTPLCQITQIRLVNMLPPFLRRGMAGARRGAVGGWIASLRVFGWEVCCHNLGSFQRDCDMSPWTVIGGPTTPSTTPVPPLPIPGELC